MATDERLAARVRQHLGSLPGIAERKMFGCIAFFINGNLACGVHDRELLVRVGADSAKAALQEPRTRSFEVNGRRMKGWLLVEVDDDKTLAPWINRGVTYAKSLPGK